MWFSASPVIARDCCLVCCTVWHLTKFKQSATQAKLQLYHDLGVYRSFQGCKESLFFFYPHFVGCCRSFSFGAKTSLQEKSSLWVTVGYSGIDQAPSAQQNSVADLICTLNISNIHKIWRMHCYISRIFANIYQPLLSAYAIFTGKWEISYILFLINDINLTVFIQR